MKSKLRIGFDVNATLDKSIELLLNLYNQKYMDNVKIEDITDYDIHKFLNPNCDNIFTEFIDDDFMSKLKLKEGAYELANWCYESGFEIRFVTAVFPEHFYYFYKFLINNFDWAKSINVCRIEDKQYYELDILLDDYEKNLIGGNYDKILLSQPWNKNIITKPLGINRANDLLEAKEDIKTIARFRGYKFN